MSLIDERIEHSGLSTYVLFSLVQYYTTKIVMYAVSALKGSERKQKTVCIILSHPSGLVLYHMYNPLIFILISSISHFLITSSHSKSFSPTQCSYTNQEKISVVAR